MSDNAEREKRRSERIEAVVLSCDLGPIVEISRQGLRVRMARVPGLQVGDHREMELSAPTDGLAVKVRVVRIDALGGGRYEVGLEFVDMTEDQHQCVENLARHGRRRPAGMFTSEEQRSLLITAMKMPNYYEVLGLTPRATAAEVQAAYRLLARKYHPDVCRDEGAVPRFCLINEANATLGDAEKRVKYDALYALRPAA